MDCKFCGRELFPGNLSVDACYQCRDYLVVCEKEHTAYLRLCLERPSKHMQPQHLKIIRFVLEKRNGLA
jgi:hypothetical protein